ncbi:hypothetical protein AMTR_s00038p00208520 [Amborella trichopoda]|uniref:Protein FAR1-RELATED SEQUENCE n=1 Tax=Amborella trichopoda TaxID=13333 RepID=U5D2T6_AMBTC|nr:hypothetical protein AMTR_s00038p00208520 [Amborella trichopoda]
MVRTTFPYEKQAAKLYTHGIFRKFVEEIQKIPPMVEESIEVEGQNTTYKVFYYNNVMLIPEHYIIRRWTKEGNKGMVSDGDGIQIKADYKEFQTARYDDLSRVAFKVVSNGSD